MNTNVLMEVRFALAPEQDLGVTSRGHRKVWPILGGRFEGERLRGRVVSGADWGIVRSDGVLELDLRVALETEDGAQITMTFFGLRDDAKHYFRTLPRFTTASPKYAFLNRVLTVSTSKLTPEGPIHVVEEVL